MQSAEVKTILLFLSVYFFIQHHASGQKQLVLLSGEKVLHRFYPGDEIVFRLKKSKSVKTSYVNNLSDTSVVTHRDTIPFHRIERVYVRRTTRANIIGGALVFGGAGLFLLDQLNFTVLQGNEPSLDRGISTSSLGGIGIGLPLLLIKKRYQKLDYRHKLLMVQKGSVFYAPDPKGYDSPFMN
jgi:hypothetical protein